MGSVVFLSAQFDVSTRSGQKVTPRHALKLGVKAQTVCPGMALPAVESMAHGRTETVGLRGNVYIAHAAATITLLQQVAQIGRENISFDKRVAKVGNAHGPAACLVQGTVEGFHTPVRAVAIVFNAGHARRTGVHKGRLHLGWRGQQRVGFVYGWGKAAHIRQQVHAPHPMSAHLRRGQKVHQQQGSQHQASQQGGISQNVLFHIFIPNAYFYQTAKI